MKIKISIFIILISTKAYSQETEVTKFDNLFTLNFSFDYRFLFLEQSLLDNRLTSNRPIDVGIGFGYKDFSAGITINIPFIYIHDYSKSKSFDINLSYFYMNSSYFDGYLKYYNGFYDQYESETDLTIMTLGVIGGYIFNKNHSLRSVYNLDRKQSVSNGSFLIGGGVFFSSVNSDSFTRDNTFHFGPNVGYSYNWIFGDNFFFNAFITLGINGVSSNDKMSIGLHIFPKFAFGYHAKTWSIKFNVNMNMLAVSIRDEMDYMIMSGLYGITFSKRL